MTRTQPELPAAAKQRLAPAGRTERDSRGYSAAWHRATVRSDDGTAGARISPLSPIRLRSDDDQSESPAADESGATPPGRPNGRLGSDRTPRGGS
eukprot:158998-Hanusia_phi.AAC.2